MAKARDPALLDALEISAPIQFTGAVWRAVRQGRDVLMPGRPGGRWDDQSFDILYASAAADGAVSEMRHHLMRGQPVMPSNIQFQLYELGCSLAKTLRLADLDALTALGVDTSRYGVLSYDQQAREYPRTQDIGEAACFLGFDGLIAPSARSAALDVMLFNEALLPNALGVLKNHGPIDWSV
jgi:RES domain-containing protein